MTGAAGVGRSVTFTHALCRAPAASVVAGLRAVDRGAPDLGEFTRHHALYVATLAPLVARLGDRLEVVETAPGEAMAANAVAINGHIFLDERAPKTAGRLAAERCNVVALPVDQAALPNGGLSCLSFRYSLEREGQA